MTSVERVDLSAHLLDLWQDKSVTLRERKPGPPERIDGMTIGVANIAPGESPHDGEMHPNGDEVLYVVSGRLILPTKTGHPAKRVNYRKAEVNHEQENKQDEDATAHAFTGISFRGTCAGG